VKKIFEFEHAGETRCPASRQINSWQSPAEIIPAGSNAARK
jgi:hypothetical protein